MLAHVRRHFARRLPFWHALLDVNITSLVLGLLFYPLDRISGFATLLGSMLVMLVYIYYAWRLEAGSGPWWRRLGRVLGWMTLLVLIGGFINWLVVRLLPPLDQMPFAVDPALLSLPAVLGSNAMLIVSIFLPARVILAMWGLSTYYLRWRITLSYGLLGAAMFGVLPLTMAVFTGVISLVGDPVIESSETTAQALATELTPLLQATTDPVTLQPVLNGLFDATTRLSGDGTMIDTRPDTTVLRGTAQVAVYLPDGTLLVEARNPAFPAAPMNIRLLLPGAQAGCVSGRAATLAIADVSVCPVFRDAQPIALVAAQTNIDATTRWAMSISRVLEITFFAFSFLLSLLAIAMVLSLSLSFGAGYLMTNKLARRLRVLTTATGQLAAGTLHEPLPVDSRDELGRLTTDFNRMAEQLREREDALRQEKERAERLLATNKRLVADISHELRTPLSTLRGYLEVLEQRNDLASSRELQVMDGEVGRLTRLIDDLFTLVRAEANQLPLRLGAVEPEPLLHRLADKLAPLARREQQIEVIASVVPGLPPVCADGMRLEQVLLNLAQNALRHTPPGGIIIFEGRLEDGQVALAVADTGTGIAPEDLPLVFERFYRSDQSRARDTGGAGLGLALVRELVMAMGGTVQAESMPQRGSRFTVLLPVADGKLVEAAV